MELTLKKDIYERYACAYSGTAGREVSEEIVVPDALPDVGKVIDAQGVLFVRAKEAGEGAVTVSATVSTSVLYVPEDGGAVQSVDVELPCELRIDAPGVDSDSRVRADVRLLTAEARAVNSRKLAVRAEVAASVQCYRRESVSVVSGAEGEGAHVLMDSAEIMTVSDVREKTFVVTDEYAVPAGLGSGVKLIARRIDAAAEDVKYVSGKIILRGRSVSELVFSDDTGNVRAARMQSEFSQIVEVDCSAPDAAAGASILLTGAYFDLPEYGEGAGRLQAELHFAMQCVCRERRTVPYMADIYANRACLVPSFIETPAIREAKPISMRQTVAGRVEPEAAGEPVIVNASVGAVSLEDGTVKTSVLVRMASRSPDGNWTPSRCRMNVEFTPAEPQTDMTLSEISVYAADVYATGSDVRAVLQMDAVMMREGVVQSVSEVAEDADAFASQAQRPSVTLVRAKSGASLWELAKRCGSSVEAIEAANGGRCDGMLLVPKAK